MSKITLDEEINIWEKRTNDEFGKLLTKINEATKDYLYSWEEFGIEYNSISEYITEYSLDGDRKWTATHIKAVLEDYDIIPNHKNVQKLIDELFKLF